MRDRTFSTFLVLALHFISIPNSDSFPTFRRSVTWMPNLRPREMLLRDLSPLTLLHLWENPQLAQGLLSRVRSHGIKELKKVVSCGRQKLRRHGRGCGIKIVLEMQPRMVTQLSEHQRRVPGKHRWRWAPARCRWRWQSVVRWSLRGRCAWQCC